MINTPYFNFEEIEAIINNPKELANYFENNNISEGGMMLNLADPIATEAPEYEGEEE